MVVGYLLAVALHRQVRGFRIARTALLIPMLLTPAAVGLMWQFMFNPDLGIIGFLLGKVGLHLNWLDSPWLAKFVIVIVDSWMNIPFVMLMVVAGMASLPPEPQEAAAVDGASWWATTRHVIIPQLKAVLIITLLVRCVDIVRLFDIIYTTTQGGPGTATQNASLIAFNYTFQFFQTGQGAAMAITLGLLTFPVYFLYVRLTRI
jgi:multiple sugar transport system permease protein